MGDFRLVIDAAGGHGCDRTARPGEALGPDCGQPSCPDHLAARFVADLASKMMLKSATLAHWPGSSTEVLDDLKHGVRLQGSFSSS